jgi:two-component system chemotaxis response regulator CheY
MRILIAEDDHASRVLLQRFFSDYGECDLAIDGIEALDAFILAHEEDEAYGLVCLDIMMPRLDGLKMLNKMREYEQANQLATVKTLIITALAEEKTRREAIEAGCSAFLSKPLEMLELEAALQQIK